MFEDAHPGLLARALVPWITGFVVYQGCLPSGPTWWVHALGRTFDAMHMPFPLVGGSLGGSAPSFLVAFVLGLVVLRRPRER